MGDKPRGLREVSNDRRNLLSQAAAIASGFVRTCAWPSAQRKEEEAARRKKLILEDPVRQANYFVGKLPREEVEMLITKEGQFAVRLTSRAHNVETSMCISVKANNKIRHFIIHMSSKGKFVISGEKGFKTISDLVKYYMTKKLVISPELGGRLLFPVERPDWIISENQVVQEVRLGEGNFGEVWKGTLNRNGSQMPVAVKFLKGTTSSSEELQFFKECRRNRLLHCRHLVTFIGIVANEDSTKLLMELCEDSLVSYLRTNAGKLEMKVKTRILIHVARGMEYLELKGVIHRDLAARNCLLKNNICKISDLGMAREGNLYQMSKDSKPLPIKWTAPDALRTGKFSHATDAWSYGVLVWEVLSEGKPPYEAIQLEHGKNFLVKLMELLDSGYRLPAPADTPPAISAVMNDCMNIDPAKRSSFKIIRESLEGYYAVKRFDVMEFNTLKELCATVLQGKKIMWMHLLLYCIFALFCPNSAYEMLLDVNEDIFAPDAMWLLKLTLAVTPLNPTAFTKLVKATNKTAATEKPCAVLSDFAKAMLSTSLSTMLSQSTINDVRSILSEYTEIRDPFELTKSACLKAVQSIHDTQRILIRDFEYTESLEYI